MELVGRSVVPVSKTSVSRSQSIFSPTELRAEYGEMLPSRGYNGLAQLSRRDTTCLLLFLVR